MTSSGSAAMTGMSMGMPTDSSMSMNSSMMMGMDSMAMVFFTSNQTPLYSWSWSPTTDGQYAGTCIFLIAFAALFRALLAIRVHFFPILAAFRRRHGQHFDNMVLLDEKTIARRPWRANEAVMVAFLDMILAGVSYLLYVSFRQKMLDTPKCLC